MVDDSLHNQEADSGLPGSTSTNLLERIRARQPEAWKRLVHLYGPLVYGWCRQTGLQAADASDVVQEVFRAVSGGVADFRREQAGDSFRGWLWTITRNKVRDHFRSRAGRADAVGGSQMQQQLAQLAQPDPPNDPTSSGPASSDAREANDEAALVHRAMQVIRGEFENSSWEAFWRMTVQGHSSAEIAADLGMTKSAVRQAKYRILRRLRQELQ